MAGVGQPGLGDLGAEALAELEHALEVLAHPGLDPLGVAGKLPGHAEPQAVEPLGAGQLDAARDPGRGRVARVATLHRAQHQGRVGDRPGQRAALIERGGEGDHPVAGDRAVGRLQADDPAERRRLADRAAGVGADRAGRQATGHRGGRAARGAAGHAVGVPGVAHRVEAGVLVRGAHRELVHVGLAEHRGTGRDKPLDRGRGVGRDVALEDPRGRGGRHALGAEDVLDRDGYAGELALIAGFERLLIAPEEGAEFVGGRGAPPRGPVLVGGQLARADPRGGLGHR